MKELKYKGFTRGSALPWQARSESFSPMVGNVKAKKDRFAKTTRADMRKAGKEAGKALKHLERIYH